MNVALTRAREALYVVGDMETLNENTDWRALRQDAIRRKALIKMNGGEGLDGLLDNVLWKHVDHQ